MKHNYVVYDDNQYAVVEVNFSVAQCLLQDDKQWGAVVLKNSGEFGWKVNLLRLQCRGIYAPRMLPQSPDRFLVHAIVGKNAFIAYLINKENHDHIRVTPVGYLPTWIKMYTGVVLAILCVVPVILAPIVWQYYQRTTVRIAKLFLDSFCRYLLDEITAPENRK